MLMMCPCFIFLAACGAVRLAYQRAATWRTCYGEDCYHYKNVEFILQATTTAFLMRPLPMWLRYLKTRESNSRWKSISTAFWSILIKVPKISTFRFPIRVSLPQTSSSHGISILYTLRRDCQRSSASITTPGKAWLLLKIGKQWK